MKNKLKLLRVEFDLTQEQLAKKLGVTRQTIIAIEKSVYDPSLKLVFKMAHFFEKSIEEIFIYEPQDPNNE